MDTNDLLINDRVDIFYENTYYKSNIQDIKEEHIAISIPAINGKYAILGLNDKINVIYYKNGGAYRFETTVIARKKEVIPIILIKKPESIIQIQRRMFVRIDLLQELKYISKNKIDKFSDDQIVNSIIKKTVELSKAILLDLSSGGMRISINEKINYGDVIFVHLNFIENGFIIKSKVVRVNKGDRNNYICGFEFVDINEKSRDTIMKYLFNIMRKQIIRM